MSSTAATADAAQLDALETGAGLCAHGLRQLLAAEGADVLPWLERLVSLPVQSASAPACLRTTFMDGKGRMRADPGVLLTGETVLLDLPVDASGRLLKLLDMFVINDDVRLVPRPELVALTLAGPRAAETLAAVELSPPEGDGLTVGADGLLVARSVLAPAPAFELIVPAEGRDALVARLTAAGALAVERPALDLLRVRAGLPWWPDELSHEVIPLEARLDQRVSTTKGCYPGQEVVARIRNLGQVARRLERVAAPAGELPAALPAELTGTGDHAGKAAGLLTSAAIDPRDGSRHGLAFLRRAFWKADTTVLQGDDGWSVVDG